MNKASNSSLPKIAKYETNPFLIAITGIERVFRFAKPLAIIFLVASIIFMLLNFNISDTTSANIAHEFSQQTTTVGATDPGLTAVFIGVVGLMVLIAAAGLFVLSSIVMGVTDVASSAAAKGKTITTSQAFEELFKDFGPYLKLRLIFTVKVFLWTLLFVLPGIYFFYRYYLAGVVFFAEGKRGNAAIKESLRLTRGSWITTFASYNLLNILTFGATQMLLQSGSQAELYRNYRQTVDSGEAHPAPHWLSWVPIVVSILLFSLLISFVALLVPMVQEVPLDTINSGFSV